MPQAVEPESTTIASPINRSGIVAISAGIISIISEAGESIGTLAAPLSKVKDLMVNTLGISTSWILPTALIGVGFAVIYWRQRQRSGGWA
jgi:hypothetical protein